jgi:hypothetical protein
MSPLILGAFTANIGIGATSGISDNRTSRAALREPRSSESEPRSPQELSGDLSKPRRRKDRPNVLVKRIRTRAAVRDGDEQATSPLTPQTPTAEVSPIGIHSSLPVAEAAVDIPSSDHARPLEAEPLATQSPPNDPEDSLQ